MEADAGQGDTRVVMMGKAFPEVGNEPESVIVNSQVVMARVHAGPGVSLGSPLQLLGEEESLGAAGGQPEGPAVEEEITEVELDAVDSSTSELVADQDWIKGIYQCYGTEEISPIATVSGPSGSNGSEPWGADSPDIVLHPGYTERWHPYFPAEGGEPPSTKEERKESKRRHDTWRAELVPGEFAGRRRSPRFYPSHEERQQFHSARRQAKGTQLATVWDRQTGEFVRRRPTLEDVMLPDPGEIPEHMQVGRGRPACPRTLCQFPSLDEALAKEVKRCFRRDPTNFGPSLSSPSSTC